MDPEKVEIMENGVIMFKQITSAQQGSYICTATNDMGTITATASLVVEGNYIIFVLINTQGAFVFMSPTNNALETTVKGVKNIL